MFRVDAPFEDTADATPSYFVNFDFDNDGNFLKAYLQINPALDNAYTLTESIMSQMPKPSRQRSPKNTSAPLDSQSGSPTGEPLPLCNQIPLIA